MPAPLEIVRRYVVSSKGSRLLAQILLPVPNPTSGAQVGRVPPPGLSLSAKRYH